MHDFQPVSPAGGYPRKLWMKLWADWGVAAARQGCRGLPRIAQKTSNIKRLCTKAGDEAVDSRRTGRCVPGGARRCAAWVFPDQLVGRRFAVDKARSQAGNDIPGKRGKSCGQSADSLLQPTPGVGCGGSLRNRTGAPGLCTEPGDGPVEKLGNNRASPWPAWLRPGWSFSRRPGRGGAGLARCPGCR